jgi:hypothetical protein
MSAEGFWGQNMTYNHDSTWDIDWETFNSNFYDSNCSQENHCSRWTTAFPSLSHCDGASIILISSMVQGRRSRSSEQLKNHAKIC